MRDVLEQSAHSHGIEGSYPELNKITDFDTSISMPNIGRFRVNVYRQRGTLALTLRVIPSEVPNIRDLNLPEILETISIEPRGLILVTGVSGRGKSTTLAAMMDHVNCNQARKIVTIEDPIEFLISDKKSSVSQRELGTDTSLFSVALRAALRQDPDIIMVGEMRDRETIEVALKASETGHTVFSTIHTRDATGAISRLLGAFEPSEHSVIRTRMAESLRATVSQRLVPRKEGEGRVAVVEIMRMTASIQERILNADPRGLQDLIEQGVQPYKMQTFDQHLTKLYREDIISFETGMSAATSPTNFKRNMMFEE